MDIGEITRGTSVPYSATVKSFPLWGAVFTSKQLPFTMQAQLASNWCWAATSNSVSHYYWFRSTFTQCGIVNAELNRTDACNSPIPSGANVPWYLDRALTRTNNFVSITGGQASFALIRSEIDAGRPVGARIGWSGGGGHFMVIYGYSVWFGVEWLDIDDPIYGKSHLKLTDFATKYQGTGTWTHYYLTKSYRKWWWPPVVIDDPVLKKIWKARQVMAVKDAIDPEHLEQAATEESVGTPAEAQFGLAHAVYGLGLDQLLSGDAEPERLGLRVYESREGSPVAFYDVDEGEDGEVRAASKSPTHLEAFRSAISAVERDLPEEGAEEAETRLLRIPALNFEALWVIGGRGEPQIVPLLGVGDLQPGRAYPLGEALAVLREAARPLAGMDDTMGA